MRPFLDMVLVLEKDGKYFNGRVEVQPMGASPALETGDANTGLKRR
jgi:hypothetical protein